MDRDFKNNSGQAERARMLREERQRLRQPPAPTSLRDLARVDEILGAQGRFAEGARVTGTDPAARYPRLPDSSPWNAERGVEPPLGYSVEEVEPVGEAHECGFAWSCARGIGSRSSLVFCRPG